MSDDVATALRGVRGLLIDLDGVVYTGPVPIPGSGWFMAEARRQGLPFLLVTNNSTTRPAQVAARLSGMAIPTQPEEIFTSAQAAAAYVRANAPQGSPVVVVGEQGLCDEVLSSGLRVADSADGVQWVVAGLDRTFDYHKLALATTAILAGARFVATNRDALLPVEGGAFLPGAGAMIGAISGATGASPVVLGKPEPGLFERGIAQLGPGTFQPHEVAMVGDRIDTDIDGAHRIGLRTILVLSGVASRADADAMPEPADVVVERIADLAPLLGWPTRFNGD